MKKLLCLIFILLFQVGCASMPPATIDSGIEGQVWIGPTCPVVQIDNPCPDKPYQTTLTVLSPNGKRIANYQTEADGTFHLSLAPGDYILRPESPGGIPHAPEQAFTVLQGQITLLTVTYDSGIR
jgi:hypothetical protein